MRSLYFKIVLIVLFVLGLFLLLMRAWFEMTLPQSTPALQQATQTVSETKSPSSPSEKFESITVTQMGRVLKEHNETLDRRYQSVASEILDFMHAKHLAKKEAAEANRTKLAQKPFVSHCPTPPKKPLETSAQKTVSKTAAVQKPLQKAKKTDRRPKLAIVMDDVQSEEEGEMIKEIPFPVTPSIFPPTSDHPHTQDVAQMFRVYMVHLPMEAFHFGSPEEDTLLVDDSFETIDAKIARIKHYFPKLFAINNHTGSKFTSDADAMDRLFCALQKYGIRFVDSRTAVTTKARLMAKLHHCKVLERNIFLDNDDSVASVLAQLKEAVRYAREHGTAIAICHPKDATFEALMRAKPILRGVDVVTIDKLY